MIPIFLILAMVVSAEITEDINPTGILFTKIAQTQLTHSDWHLCYHYDLSQSEHEIPKIERSISSLERICSALSKEYQENVCHTILELLKSRLSQIQETENIIQSYQSSKTRKRRAPLEIVGSLASYLFGTLDQSDADRYDTKIAELEQNQSFHRQMIAEQTTIMRSELNLHNQTYSEVKSKLDKFSNELKGLTGWLAFKEEQLELQSRFTSLVHLAHLIADHHDGITDAVLNLLSTISRGRVVGLIPIKQLASGLTEIADNLESDTELPIGKKENPYHIFRFALVRTHISESRLLIELTIPILDRERFMMYEATSIPTHFKEPNDLLMIKPEEAHFLTNSGFDKFVPMLPDEVKACQPLRGENILCSQSSTTQRLDKRNCELTLLNDMSSSTLPESCVITRVPKRNYVIRLPTRNHYYLVVSHPIKAKMFCQGKTQSISLMNNAFVKLEEGCQMVGQEFAIRARGKTRSSTQNIEIPSLNLTNYSFTDTANYSLTYPQKTLVIRDFKSEFQALSDQLSESEKEAKHLEGLSLNKKSASNHDKILYSITIVLTLVLFFSCLLTHRERIWICLRRNVDQQESVQRDVEYQPSDAAPSTSTGVPTKEPVYAKIRIIRK